MRRNWSALGGRCSGGRGRGCRGCCRRRSRGRVAGGHDSAEVGECAQLVLQTGFVVGPKLEPLPPSQEGPVLEHGDCLGVQRPVGTLARPVRPPGDLDEAVVEAEVVPQRVLPPLRVAPVVGEVVHDEPVDLREWEHPLRAVPERHGSEGDVGVGRLLLAVAVP